MIVTLHTWLIGGEGDVRIHDCDLHSIFFLTAIYVWLNHSICGITHPKSIWLYNCSLIAFFPSLRLTPSHTVYPDCLLFTFVLCVCVQMISTLCLAHPYTHIQGQVSFLARPRRSWTGSRVKPKVRMRGLGGKNWKLKRAYWPLTWICLLTPDMNIPRLCRCNPYLCWIKALL